MTGRHPLVVVGDALLDRDVTGRAERLSPDAPVPVVSAVTESERPGGAALAALLAALDRPAGGVVLVTALSADPAGERLAELLAAAGVTVVATALPGRTPVKERVRVAGQSLLRLDREEAAVRPVAGTPAMREVVEAAGAVLVSDYGRGLLAGDDLRGWLAGAARRVPVVWDPHPRGGQPVPWVRLATPNLGEALGFAGTDPRPRAAGADPPAGAAADLPPGAVGSWPGDPGPAGTERAGAPVTAAARAGRLLAARWRAGGVAVTLGAGGALLATADDVPLVVPAPAVAGGDPCGAGDRFASAVATRLAAGLLPSEAVTAGVAAASAYVGAGGPSSLPPVPAPRASGEPPGVDEVVRRTRAAGGTVVATGGCFDLLHAGHVATLEAARRLGDCLVVCVNSDASVRRLKGPSRPLVPVRDRVRVLAALGCVDAVTVFDEDTPLAVLDRIRPDVWVKGGDYTVSTLPETELLAGWGGEVVVVPYLEGRSTSRLVEMATGSTGGTGRHG